MTVAVTSKAKMRNASTAMVVTVFARPTGVIATEIMAIAIGSLPNPTEILYLYHLIIPENAVHEELSKIICCS
jgi:hypothetical protein